MSANGSFEAMRPRDAQRAVSPAAASFALSIRSADFGDSPSLASLMGQLGYPTREEEMTARLEGLLPREDHLVAVAVLEGRVAGVVAAAVGVCLEKNGRRGRVTALIVTENLRGRGIGAHLLGHAESWLRARGAAACTVNTSTRRARAHRFYEREGYRVTGLRFEKSLD
jgi:GNAT superfamily N-acetyltransferase